MRKKFACILIGTISVITLSGCGGSLTTSGLVEPALEAEDSNTEVYIKGREQDSSLEQDKTYTVLDVREFASADGYGGSYKDAKRTTVLIVEDVETGNRVYVTTEIESDYIDNTDSTDTARYKNLAVLVAGDSFKYLGSSNYELITE